MAQVQATVMDVKRFDKHLSKTGACPPHVPHPSSWMQNTSSWLASPAWGSTHLIQDLLAGYHMDAIYLVGSALRNLR
jgi:hypothetical protein